MQSIASTAEEQGPSPHAVHWDLDPQVTFLNHGSFGAAPRAVLAVQSEWRARMERQPVRFFQRELEGALDGARSALASLVRADGDDLAFVPNATSGVNTVLRSLEFAPGDQLLTTDHAYNACANALRFAAERAGAEVVLAPVPFPLTAPEQVVDALLAAVTPRTRLVLLDHVTSPTGLVLPLEALVPLLESRGIAVLVDGAHALGMLPLDLDRLGASFYTANAHKWLCAPKGAAFLHVRRDRQSAIRPLAISHGANAPLAGRSRFRREFDWTGTQDPSAWLAIPAAIEFLGGLLPGGLPALMERNRRLAAAGRDLLLDALSVPSPAPASMLGSLASVPVARLGLPDGEAEDFARDPLQDRLYRAERIEVPVMPWPALGARLLRIAMQAYNDLGQVRRLAEALRAMT